MIVLSHRGYWNAARERNMPVAFQCSFDLGFGTETDVRDCRGELLISHDMPRGDELTLARFLALHGGRPLPLAINIKSDGLAAALADAMRRCAVRDWFVFDMSVPDLRNHLAAGNPVFTRMSEHEREPAFLEQAQGVWLDMFDGQWYDGALVAALLHRGKRVCVVSSELHGAPPGALWASLLAVADHPGLMLCTDVPEAARQYFSGSAVCA